MCTLILYKLVYGNISPHHIDHNRNNSKSLPGHNNWYTWGTFLKLISILRMCWRFHGLLCKLYAQKSYLSSRQVLNLQTNQKRVWVLSRFKISFLSIQLYNKLLIYPSISYKHGEWKKYDVGNYECIALLYRYVQYGNKI